jgi:hypothetical protein
VIPSRYEVGFVAAVFVSVTAFASGDRGMAVVALIVAGVVWNLRRFHHRGDDK